MEGARVQGRSDDGREREECEGEVEEEKSFAHRGTEARRHGGTDLPGIFAARVILYSLGDTIR